MVRGKGRNKPVSGNEQEDEEDFYEFDDEPHPAFRICDYLQKLSDVDNGKKEHLKWEVKIKKYGQLEKLDEISQTWYRNAFGKRRNQMYCSFKWL